MNGPTLSRRGFLGGGALVVGFTLFPRGLLAQAPQEGDGGTPPGIPKALNSDPLLESWIRIDTDGHITVFTGKAELGQGIRTSLLQVAAEELAVDPAGIALVTADTDRTPNESYTAGSQSMQESGTAILHASARVAGILRDLAARRLGVPAASLKLGQGAVAAPDGRSLGYGELVAGGALDGARAEPGTVLKDPASYSVIGSNLPRVDIPAKVTGGIAYVHDMRLPGMVHARVVRPPSYGATIREVDTDVAERMPGVIGTLRDGNYLAVVAEREWQAVNAMRVLAKSTTWDERETLPDRDNLFRDLQALKSDERVIQDRRNDPSAVGGAIHRLESEFHRGYQIHGSIGPSCAVGLFRDGVMTVWSHGQGMFPLRSAIAEMLRMDEAQVHCIHAEGAGCYGHNGADDAGRRRCPGEDRRLPVRGLEQPPLHPPRRGERPDAGLASGRSVQAQAAQADPAAGRRRRPQRDPALRPAQYADRPPLHPRNAGPDLGIAGTGRLHECFRAGKLHG